MTPEQIKERARQASLEYQGDCYMTQSRREALVASIIAAMTEAYTAGQDQARLEEARNRRHDPQCEYLCSGIATYLDCNCSRGKRIAELEAAMKGTITPRNKA